MKSRRRFKSSTLIRALSLLGSSGLIGCGLTVPQVSEFWDRDYPPTKDSPTLTATAQIEYEIKQKVYCELRYAVREAEAVLVFDQSGHRRLLIPRPWGIQLQLSLEVDESISLNPNVSFTQLLPNVMKIFGVFPANSVNKATLNSVTVAQTFSLGFGGTLSSQALRTDKFNTYYSVEDLIGPRPTVCQSDGKPDLEKDPLYHRQWPPAVSSPLLVESNLGIKDWLFGAMYVDNALASSSPQPSPASTGGGKLAGTFKGNFEGPLKGGVTGTFTSSGGSSSGGGKSSSGGGGSSSGGGPQDLISQEIKFIIVSSGNVTPTWKLIQVSANTGNTPFFSTGRTRTHDLLMTVGPPTQRTVNDFLAAQIGQAVTSGVRAATVQAVTSGVSGP